MRGWQNGVLSGYGKRKAAFLFHCFPESKKNKILSAMSFTEFSFLYLINLQGTRYKDTNKNINQQISKQNTTKIQNKLAPRLLVYARLTMGEKKVFY